MLFDVAVLGAGAAGMMCAAVAGQRACAWSWWTTPSAWPRKSAFPAGPLQFHQSRRRPRQLPVREPALLPFGAGGLYAAGFPGAAQAPSRVLAREASRPAVLRRFQRIHHRAAARRVRRRPGGLAHGLFGGRDRPRRAGLRAAHQPGPHPCGQAGRGHRRHGDPAAGRHRFRPEDRAPVRPENRRATARAGAADLRRGAMAAFVGAVRRGAGSEPVHGAGQGARRIPRRPAVHASRAVGAGDFADFQLLEAGRAHRGGPGAGP